MYSRSDLTGSFLIVSFKCASFHQFRLRNILLFFYHLLFECFVLSLTVRKGIPSPLVNYYVMLCMNQRYLIIVYTKKPW